MWCGETLSLLYWLRRNLGKPSCLKIGVSFSRFHTVYLCFLGNYYFFYFLFNASNIARNSWMCVRYFYSYFCKIMYIWRLKNIFFAHFKTNSNSVFFVVVLVSPDFRLLTFIFSTSVGRGDWNETVKKQFFGSGGEVMNLAKKYQQLIFSCYKLIPINAFRSLEVCIPAVARKSF